MISISPATYSFGPIHTEREASATLFLGNPTYVDAEWSLSHIPAPPPKYRRSFSRAATSTAAGRSSRGCSQQDDRSSIPCGSGNGSTEAIDINIHLGSGYANGSDVGVTASSGSFSRGDPANVGIDHGAALVASPLANGEVRGEGRGQAGSSNTRGSNTSGGGGRLPQQRKTRKPRQGTADAAPGYVDDPTVFFFKETSGTSVGVKLPLSSSAACLPEDWNRLEVKRRYKLLCTTAFALC